MSDLNRAFSALLNDALDVPRAQQFPGGFRWRYWRAPKKGRKRAWDCAYSTTRNANGKFVSWVIDWRGGVGHTAQRREHTKRKDAKARALRLYETRVSP